MSNSQNEELDAIADVSKGLEMGRRYVNPPERCDQCGVAFSTQTYMIDGAVNGSVLWANMCPVCFGREGSGIGWGSGQLYWRMADGGWLMVGGFPPEEENS